MREGSGQAPTDYNAVLTQHRQSDTVYWILAFLFAAAAGYAHVRINDSGLAVVFVASFTMFLAYKRSQRIWRWILVMGLSLPVATLIGQLTRIRPTLGMVAGSFAGLAFAVVAGIGGQVLRRVVLILFPKRETQDSNAGDSQNP